MVLSSVLDSVTTDKEFRNVLAPKRSNVRPNQSLKLTEPAVDDFARAKQPATIGLTYHARNGYRRRGASPPQLSSGSLGGKKNLGRKDRNSFDLSSCVHQSGF